MEAISEDVENEEESAISTDKEPSPSENDDDDDDGDGDGDHDEVVIEKEGDQLMTTNDEDECIVLKEGYLRQKQSKSRWPLMVRFTHCAIVIVLGVLAVLQCRVSARFRQRKLVVDGSAGRPIEIIRT